VLDQSEIIEMAIRIVENKNEPDKIHCNIAWMEMAIKKYNKEKDNDANSRSTRNNCRAKG